METCQEEWADVSKRKKNQALRMMQINIFKSFDWHLGTILQRSALLDWTQAKC